MTQHTAATSIAGTSIIIISFMLLQSCKDQGVQGPDTDPGAQNPCSVPAGGAQPANLMSGILPAGEYKMVSWVSWDDGAEKSIGVTGASAADEAEIEQRAYVENRGQEWEVIDLGGAEYSIVNVHSDKALGVPGGEPDRGLQLHQAPYTGSDGQRWIVENPFFGVYRIKSKLDPSLGLIVEDGSTADGAAVRLDSLTNSDSCMMLYPVDYTTTSTRFMALPDTQSYVEWEGQFYNRLTSQINWVLGNKESISLVLQQGDLTNRNIPAQWQFIQDAFSSFDNEVPYVLAVGNHDMGPNGDASNRDTAYFNEYFPYSAMSDLPSFGGVFEENKMDNAYYLLETGAYKWLVMSLEFGPRDSVLEWADSLASRYSDRTGIITTHAHLYSDSTHHQAGDRWNPYRYGVANVGEGVNAGNEVWEKLIRSNSNIRFVLSGHVLHDGCGTLVGTNDAGYPVYQFLANFQDGVDGSQNGGDGYLRDMILDFEEKELVVSSYSAYPDIGTHPSDCHNFEIIPLEIVGL